MVGPPRVFCGRVTNTDVAAIQKAAAWSKGHATPAQHMLYYDTSPNKDSGNDDRQAARESCKDSPAPPARILPNRHTTTENPAAHGHILGSASVWRVLKSARSRLFAWVQNDAIASLQGSQDHRSCKDSGGASA